MLMYLFYVVAILCITLLLSILAFLWWSDYVNEKGKDQPFRIVYNASHSGATLWRNTHPSFRKNVRMQCGSVIVLPSNCWIEINPDSADKETFLHELGHLMVDIAWLSLEGDTYYAMIKASPEDYFMETTLEIMAWGAAAQLGAIDKEWLMFLMIQLYKRLWGETKIRTAVMIAVSTPLVKKDIVHSTRRVLKVLYM